MPNAIENPNGGAFTAEPAAPRIESFCLNATVGDVVNAIPALNYLLLYGEGTGAPPSLIFSMMVAEVVEAIGPHIEAYNLALRQYRQSIGLTEKLAAFETQFGVRHPTQWDARWTPVQRASAQQKLGSADPDAVAAFDRELASLLEQVETQDASLRKVEIAVQVGKLPLSLLQGENIRLTGQQAHALRWLIRRDVPLPFVSDPAAPSPEPA